VALSIVEVEGYYHAPGHEDPFTHRHPLQQRCGAWYFHRSGKGYRGGSFKGLDLAFGGPSSFGGFLIRGIRREDGHFVHGPSRCVDLLLALTGACRVAQLDDSLEGRQAWEPTLPLRLEWLEGEARPPALSTARVGLTLRKHRGEEALRFLLSRYRYLTHPRATARGKAHMALAMLLDGHSAEEAHQTTGCPMAAIRRYLAAHAEGARARLEEVVTLGPIGSLELARLYGFWKGKSEEDLS
jgi:hypothetical protein